jgi:DNA repair protein SbcD/Mre11
MRFLHTSDWHVGKTIGGKSRGEEHRAVLAEILAIAVTREADCLLITGDVFESAAPGTEAEEIVYSFFRDLGRKGIPAVVIAGNHDHERKLAAVAGLLEVVQVTVRHDFRRPDSGGVIELTSDRGEKAAIGTIPFIPEHRMFKAADLMGQEELPFTNYAENMKRILADFAGALGRHPNPIKILMGHMHIDRSELGGGERRLEIGQTYAVPAPSLPAGLHYIALGHIHRPQAIPAPSPTRFAGSPLALDFGETRQEKSVVLIDVKSPRQPAAIETIPLHMGRALRDLRGTLAALEEAAASIPADDYVRVFVDAAGPVPGLAEEVRKFLPNAVDVRLIEQGEEPAADSTPERLAAGRDPADVYAAYHRAKHRADPQPELLGLFRELHHEAGRGTTAGQAEAADGL